MELECTLLKTKIPLISGIVILSLALISFSEASAVQEYETDCNFPSIPPYSKFEGSAPGAIVWGLNEGDFVAFKFGWQVDGKFYRKTIAMQIEEFARDKTVLLIREYYPNDPDQKDMSNVPTRCFWRPLEDQGIVVTRTSVPNSPYLRIGIVPLFNNGITLVDQINMRFDFTQSTERKIEDLGNRLFGTVLHYEFQGKSTLPNVDVSKYSKVNPDTRGGALGEAYDLEGNLLAAYYGSSPSGTKYYFEDSMGSFDFPEVWFRGGAGIAAFKDTGIIVGEYEDRRTGLYIKNGIGIVKGQQSSIHENLGYYSEIPVSEKPPKVTGKEAKLGSEKPAGIVEQEKSDKDWEDFQQRLENERLKPVGSIVTSSNMVLDYAAEIEDLNIQPSHKFTIADVRFRAPEINGKITIYGEMEIKNTMKSNGILQNFNLLSIKDGADLSGNIIENYGTIHIYDGRIGGVILKNEGEIVIHEEGHLSTSSGSVNSGTITNQGLIWVHGKFENEEYIRNEGKLSNFMGVFTNHGTIDNTGGKIDNRYPMELEPGVIDNKGVIDNTLGTINTGSDNDPKSGKLTGDPVIGPSSNISKTNLGGGCLIATATFGTELAPQVQQLRELRDNTLLQTNSGSLFMSGFNSFYYTFSPTIADWERQSPIFKEVVKIAITPLITSLSILNYVDVDSEAEVLGYGIGLILLNVGMYIVAPVGIGIFVFRKKSKFV